MSGAIWSCPPCEMLRFPARTLVRFFANHHLLCVTGQPQWYTVTGGAQEYVDRLTRVLRASHPHRLRRRAVTRETARCRGARYAGRRETYDQVVLACHGDETLRC